MSKSWQGAYKQLQDFVARNPGIEIGKKVTCILEDVRPEFYRLFDTVRVTFLEEQLQALLVEAKTLSRSYTTVEEEIIKLLGLDSVKLPVRLHYFLHDPANGLARFLFNPLFDLLKAKTKTQK